MDSSIPLLYSRGNSAGLRQRSKPQMQCPTTMHITAKQERQDITSDVSMARPIASISTMAFELVTTAMASGTLSSCAEESAASVQAWPEA